MIGTGELILILGIVLLLFGGKKLPELAKSLGAGLKEFKKAYQESSGDCSSCACIKKEGKDCKEESKKDLS